MDNETNDVLFTCTVKKDEDWYRRSAGVMLKPGKSFVLTGIFIFLFLLVALLGAYIGDSPVLTVECLTVTLILLLITVLSPERYIRLSKKAETGMPKTEPTEIVFRTAVFTDKNSLAYREHSYALIRQIRESPDAIMLHATYLCYVIPKSSFTKGTPEEFMSFIGAVTGKKIEKTKPSSLKKRILLFILCAVFSAAACVGLRCARSVLSTTPKDFSAAFSDGTQISATLTRDFRQTLAEEDYIQFNSTANFMVDVSQFTDKEIRECYELGEDEAFTTADLAKTDASYYSAYTPECGKLSSGADHYGYFSENYSTLSAYLEKDGKYYVVDIIAMDGSTEEEYAVMKTWAESIKIN